MCPAEEIYMRSEVEVGAMNCFEQWNTEVAPKNIDIRQA
jgi:hypothetical protein